MVIRASIVALVLLVLPVTALGGGMPVALRVPAKLVCVDEPIRVGVRHTGVVYDRLPYNRNPRWFSVRIVDPQGRRVFSRSGEATARWRFWTYEPSRVGVYRTHYGTAAFATSFRTTVESC